MSISSNEIKHLSDKAVSLFFKNSCSLDVQVAETSHLDEGNDFLAKVLKVNCINSEHYHPQVGDFINIHVSDIYTLKAIHI